MMFNGKVSDFFSTEYSQYSIGYTPSPLADISSGSQAHLKNMRIGHKLTGIECLKAFCMSVMSDGCEVSGCLEIKVCPSECL